MGFCFVMTVNIKNYSIIALCYFLFFFLVFFGYVSAAERNSGGDVLFDDVPVATTNQSKTISKSTTAATSDVVKAPNTDKPVTKVEIIKPALETKQQSFENTNDLEQEILEELPLLTKEELLDQRTIFKPNQELDFYGVNLLVLRMELLRDAKGRLIGLSNNEPQGSTTHIKKTDNPDYFLSIEKNHERTRMYTNYELPKSQKDLLKSFLKKVPKNKDALVLMYLSGSNLKTYSAKEMIFERTVFAQYITSYLYRNKKKLRIERRYVDNLPEDEILLIISHYEGNLPINVYNASKGNIIQWLSKYKDLEKKNIAEANKSKSNLEGMISTTGELKGNDLYLSPVERPVEDEGLGLKSNKDVDSLTRRPPREDESDALGPRRVKVKPQVIQAEQQVPDSNIAVVEDPTIDTVATQETNVTTDLAQLPVVENNP